MPTDDPGRPELRAGPQRGFSSFDILDEIGQGGSATVFRARHRTVDAVVAVKRWTATLSEDRSRKFLEECRLQWKLADHPNIVRILWASDDDESHAWLAMELYELSLLERISTGASPTWDEAWQWADDILSGLTAIHALDHLHRDIKPANVLLKNGRAALADLGISMQLGAPTTDTTAGTQTFTAPELSHGAHPSYASDVYSAGVTLHAIFPRPRPWELEKLLTKATSVNAADRPKDAADFLHQFRAARASAVEQPQSSADRVADHPDPATQPDSGTSTAHPRPDHQLERRARIPQDTPGRPGRPRKRVLVTAGISIAVILIAATTYELRSEATSGGGDATPASNTSAPANAASGDTSRTRVDAVNGVTSTPVQATGVAATTISLLTPPDGSTVEQCAIFTGNSVLDPGKTLVLSVQDLDNGDQNLYFQGVLNWAQPEKLGSWEGAQFFGQQDGSGTGQYFQVDVLEMPLADVAQSMADAATNHEGSWHASDLPADSVVEAKVTLLRVPGSGSDQCQHLLDH